VDTGDDLPPDAAVRVGPGAYAELARGNSVITLSRAGTYNVADLLKAAGAAASWGMASVVNAKLTALGSGARTSGAQAAQMGVRAEAKAAGGVTWVEDEAEESITRGVALLSEGRNAEALRAFLEAVESASGDETRAASRFYAAYAHDRLGEHAQAVRVIASVTPDPGAEYYRDFVLLKARLLIETAAPAEALPGLDAFLAGNPAVDDGQAAHMLAAFACRALGDSRSAVRRLEAARSLAPGSELGRRADGLIAEMEKP
jgi:hypothetical protein